PHILASYEKWFANPRGNALRQWANMLAQRTTTATHWLRLYSQRGDAWAELALEDPKSATALHELMQKATLWSIHPDKPYMDRANRHLQGVPGSLAQHTELAAKWAALPPKFQAFYLDTLKWSHGAWSAFVYELAKQRTAMSKVQLAPLTDDEILAEPERALKAIRRGMMDARQLGDLDAFDLLQELADNLTRPGPYFPLRRFGDWMVIASTPTLAEEMTREQLNEAKKDPAFRPENVVQGTSPDSFIVTYRYYLSESYESIAEARARARQLSESKKFESVHWKTKDDAIFT
ncbi:MAG: hypothetical protein N2544_17755, partial [Burkholderiales bacterium]|nr:hypothetical protein [Burkholderiales bacterium]